MYEYLDRRYALALYEVGEERQKLEEYINDFNDIVGLLKTNQDVIQVVNHPQVSTSEKKKIFMEIFKGKIDEKLLNFLLLLIEKKRIHDAEGILSQLNIISLEKHNKVIADVKTVIPLTEVEKTTLTSKLSAKYNKTVILKEIIDKSIIGGVYVRVGDDVIDGTVKFKLDSMKKLMLKKG
ncbi:F0F1 ATP synthase subunit delta [Clostridium felsineum]|uniref:ATP synthase subunit delta n=1 Tax=Clostridium felsineum TaxID=36839 RepID=A0A1S8LQ82_9CLOT|nr:F0F1 ATP synthase subunit delta [Clostridium felsineum]MCR3758385.1 F0F1 ATP synthase subunit delta [Clostridium felsineum]URZ03746.1 ATP synthase subunit delta, sodium ion specific [Clostridium felsineum]URZ07948.1 ATP synthase subunit delta, sodium ion specific [Clostridium felsineum]URZ12979.1 ATP synthase subunit delta, sodium ion specific [Clostridium felsineum]